MLFSLKTSLKMISSSEDKMLGKVCHSKLPAPACWVAFFVLLKWRLFPLLTMHLVTWLYLYPPWWVPSVSFINSLPGLSRDSSFPYIPSTSYLLAGAEICSANVNRNCSGGKNRIQQSLIKCPWDTSSRKDPKKGSCWIIMLSSRKLAITAETIPQESIPLSNKMQLSGIWFLVGGSLISECQ